MKNQASKERINEILEECREDNWDGYGAKKITKEDIKPALKFLSILKKNLSEEELKDIELTPSTLTSVDFDYFFDHKNQASLSIYNENIISWIVVIKGKIYEGEDSFDNPEKVFKNIKSMLQKV